MTSERRDRSADRRRAGGDLRPELRALLGHWALNGRALHLTLVVDNHAGVVLEINEGAFLSAPRLLLPDHHALQHLLPQLGLPLFHGAEDHIAALVCKYFNGRNIWLSPHNSVQLV